MAIVNRGASRAALVSIATASTLIALKALTAVLTGSLAVVGSLIDSVMDVVSSSANFLALRQSEVPADADHRWGHGKAESLAAVAQALLVAASGGVLIWQAAVRLAHPKPLADLGVGVAVMTFSAVASAILTSYLRRAARRYDSVALAGDALHYASDAATNTAALVALLAFELLGVLWVDAVVSFVIACVLMRSAWLIGRVGVDQLMDRELPETERARIEAAARAASTHVIDVRELKTRHAGRHVVFELTVVLPADLSLREAHDIQSAIEDRLAAEWSGAMIAIHAEPPDAHGKSGG